MYSDFTSGGTVTAVGEESPSAIRAWEAVIAYDDDIELEAETAYDDDIELEAATAYDDEIPVNA
jgi:hypothetical protein